MSVRTPSGGSVTGRRINTRPSRFVSVPSSSAHWYTGSTTWAAEAAPRGPSRSVSVATAQRPISAVSWRTVVSAGSAYAANATSSNPTRLMSPGACRPARRIARRAPIAMRSL